MSLLNYSCINDLMLFNTFCFCKKKKWTEFCPIKFCPIIYNKYKNALVNILIFILLLGSVKTNKKNLNLARRRKKNIIFETWHFKVY